MARTAKEVDKSKLVEAIQRAETKGPLKTQTEVFQKAAEIYNKSGVPSKISHTVAMLRVQEWGIQLKTPKARNRGGENVVENTDLQKKVIDAIHAVEAKKTFETRQALWEAVVAHLKDESIKVHHVYQIFKASGVTIKTASARGKNRGSMTPERIAAMQAARGQRRSRGEKFAKNPASVKAIERLREHFDDPNLSGLLDRLANGSLSAAVKLHCLDCTAGVKSEIKNCTGCECALWLFRPYQKSQVVDGQIVEDEETEEVEEGELVEA